MAFLSRICFSARVSWLTFLLLPGLAASASVNGAIQIIHSSDSNVVRHADFSGVIVWLRPIGFSPKRDAPRHARMIQKNKQFSPHILAIDTGDSVDFPNFDPIFHNAFSSFDGVLFDIGLYPPGSSRSIRFGRPGIVRVFCNIHPTMSAVIAVLDSPYFDITAKSGAYTIAGLPAGRYELHIIHERSTQETLDKLVREVTVPDAGASLPLISISESGYLPAPHKNKYGRDYPPAVTDSSGYARPPQ